MDLPRLFAQAVRPKGVFRASVSYEDRHLAKDSGFRWDSEARIWFRKMAIEDAGILPFPVVKIRDC